MAIEPTHNLEGAAAFLDGPIGWLSPLTAVWDRTKLQGIQAGIRQTALPWTFKGKVEKLVHIWATIAGVLDEMASHYPGLRTERGGHPFVSYTEAARDHAGALIAEAERRRAGDSGGLWGIWAAGRDSASQLSRAGGLGDPFDVQRALGGSREGSGLFFNLLPLWPVAVVAVGAAWLIGPRLLEGAIAGWRKSRSASPRVASPRGVGTAPWDAPRKPRGFIQ